MFYTVVDNERWKSLFVELFPLAAKKNEMLGDEDKVPTKESQEDRAKREDGDLRGETIGYVTSPYFV